MHVTMLADQRPGGATHSLQLLDDARPYRPHLVGIEARRRGCWLGRRAAFVRRLTHRAPPRLVTSLVGPLLRLITMRTLVGPLLLLVTVRLVGGCLRTPSSVRPRSPGPRLLTPGLTDPPLIAASLVSPSRITARWLLAALAFTTGRLGALLGDTSRLLAPAGLTSTLTGRCRGPSTCRATIHATAVRGDRTHRSRRASRTRRPGPDASVRPTSPRRARNRPHRR